MRMPEFGTRLHTAKTKSSAGGEQCKYNDDTNPAEVRSPRPVTAKEVGKITDRLYSANTKSTGKEACKYEATVAKDIIGPSNVNEDDVVTITQRLAESPTKSWTAEVCKISPTVAEPLDFKLPEYEVDEIVDRLNRTHTASSSAKPCRATPTVAENIVAREPATEEEIKTIFSRLQTTHTKSSNGGAECKPHDPPAPQGLGHKMLPIIDGLEERFKGDKAMKKEKADSVFTRLTSAHTRSSRARGESPKILLYPERTLLCNNVTRIVNYQNTGEVVKQATLARREKWFV